MRLSTSCLSQEQASVLLLLQPCPTSVVPTPPDPDNAALRALVVQQRDECQKGRWRFRFRERDIIVRDEVAKVLAWLDKFKQVGDMAVNFDPHHAALPWAGVRLLLEVCLAVLSLRISHLQ